MSALVTLGNRISDLMSRSDITGIESAEISDLMQAVKAIDSAADAARKKLNFEIIRRGGVPGLRVVTEERISIDPFVLQSLDGINISEESFKRMVSLSNTELKNWCKANGKNYDDIVARCDRFEGVKRSSITKVVEGRTL